MRINDRSLAYALLRISLGINFAGHGLIRIHNGVAAFAQTTSDHLAKSPLPPGIVHAFSYTIPFLEAILGLTLILGIFTRISLACGAIFMMLLTIGITANQQWDVATQQLLYSLVFFVLLFLYGHNQFSLDTALRRTTEN
jgi:thiosulfate dehydrogenase [quinone] large subunit